MLFNIKYPRMSAICFSFGLVIPKNVEAIKSDTGHIHRGGCKGQYVDLIRINGTK